MRVTRRRALKAGLLGAGAAAVGLPLILSRPSRPKPNIIIYLSDTLRADHLHTYGYPLENSPNLDAFAKQGVRFDKAYSSSPWTKPAIGTILTGLVPLVHRATANVGATASDPTAAQSLRPIFATLAEHLRDLDYRTAYFLNNANVQKQFGFAQGFDDYQFGTTEPDGFTSDFFAWHTKNVSEKPYFAFIHEIDPHGPYLPKPETYSRLHGSTIEEDRAALSEQDNDLVGALFHRYLMKEEGIQLARPALKKLSAAGIAHLKALYDAEIHQIDQQFGRIIRFLQRNETYENTIVVFLADHGEGFGEHDTPFRDGDGNLLDWGGFFHGHSLYDELIHVPLIFGGGPIKPTASVPHSVGLVDIYPTLLALAGARPPFHSCPDLKIPTNGKPLFDPKGRLAVRAHRHVYTDIDYYSPNIEDWDASLVYGQYKVMTHGEDIRIFDLRNDPLEQINIEKERDQNPALADLVRRLTSTKDRHITLAKQIGEPEWVRGNDQIREQIEALGYFQ